MAEPNPRPAGTAPGPLRAVRVILYVQAAATVLGLVGTAVEVKSRFDHGQDVPGITYVLGMVSLVCAVAAVVLAASVVARGRFWARRSVMALEVVTIVYGFINIFAGAVAGIGEIVVGAAVIVLAARHSVGEWMEGREGDVGAHP
ncbi:MAG TPA: hypothetical protein VGL93_24510 [Streptosporangiaceae bacterium]